jgi:hypothetical protein
LRCSAIVTGGAWRVSHHDLLLCQKQNQVRRFPGAPDFYFPFGSRVTITPIAPRSIRADVSAPAIAEIASAAVDTDTATVDADTATTAPTSTAATGPTAATSTAATAGLCLRGGCAHQDGRGTDDVNQHQSQCCKAAREDIVAFHFQNLPVSSHLNFNTPSRLDVRDQFWFEMGAKIDI